VHGRPLATLFAHLLGTSTLRINSTDQLGGLQFVDDGDEVGEVVIPGVEGSVLLRKMLPIVGNSILKLFRKSS